MNIFSSRFINTISLVISIVFFLIINESLNVLFKDDLETKFINNKIIENKLKSIFVKNDEEGFKWYIEIPSINLKAPIEQGTDAEILDKSVGHFTQTPDTLGNVGLAGHNRGYEKSIIKKMNLKKDM